MGELNEKYDEKHEKIKMLYSRYFLNKKDTCRYSTLYG